MSAIHAHNAASHLGQAPTTCKAELLSCSGAMLRLRGGDGDDEDLFADDEEGDVAAAAELKAKAAAAKDKAKADKPPAKTNIILDVKGWGEETDMAELEKSVRSIVMEGLLWGASGLEDVGYGIKKLRITCVVEDEKVSVDLLEENITNFEELVQSVDVAAMNKI
mmetsp:Transcript_43154/g.69276  ORF Transcript_43154/g.69276 Transcript_43154/m.69276 type:complete len:165 (+) Transcript_43154:38-532(+)|eukprot:CAMPEP_0179471046 /NCGR_PEP_ID=MMETSP0799-20121207/51364_1 /TAXON_ID=46947 /ORGANISM="Geminigera cryophila, Strain CCMP2564" /LENGTH=164 /DNA_ID=CAMNT_0021278441 /DNA_START=21 /DNA_END=515 /DNA_ORIENTATION=-